MACSEVVMGGGNRSSKVLLDPKELHKIPGMQVVEELAKAKE
jgi:prolyl-tRNA editing enzyme YbaK/EbsC (Cys-tRNA(Pro) deacylase)